MKSEDRWPYGKSYLVPKRGTIVGMSHPLTINGKPVRPGDVVEAGGIISPAGKFFRAGGLLIQDLIRQMTVEMEAERERIRSEARANGHVIVYEDDGSIFTADRE